jgi:hypothetical protein
MVAGLLLTLNGMALTATSRLDNCRHTPNTTVSFPAERAKPARGRESITELPARDSLPSPRRE